LPPDVTMEVARNKRGKRELRDHVPPRHTEGMKCLVLNVAIIVLACAPLVRIFSHAAKPTNWETIWRSWSHEAQLSYVDGFFMGQND